MLSRGTPLLLALCALAACRAPADAEDAGGEDAGAEDAGVEDAGAEDAGDAGVDDGADAGAVVDGALASARDRLLATLGADRCAVWAGFDDDQRAEFLVVTDLLDKSGPVSTSSDSALAHVTRLFAVRGRQSSGCVRCCGDREFNRVFFAADDALLARLRAHDLGGWRASRDPGGPHTPFTQSDETERGQPRGQTQLFANDTDAVPLARPGVSDVDDPRAVEIDLDFNLVHESAPLCTYGGDDGLARYEELWGDAALDYAPTGC